MSYIKRATSKFRKIRESIVLVYWRIMHVLSRLRLIFLYETKRSTQALTKFTAREQLHSIAREGIEPLPLPIFVCSYS